MNWDEVGRYFHDSEMGKPALRRPTFSSQQVGKGQRGWEDWEKAPDMEKDCDRGSGGNHKLHLLSQRDSEGDSEFAEKRY